MTKRSYFKTKEKIEKKRKVWSTKLAAEAKTRKLAWLASPEGKEAVRKISACSDLAKILAVQVLTEQQIKDKMREYDFDSLIDRS
jgi:hypothetical protein